MTFGVFYLVDPPSGSRTHIYCWNPIGRLWVIPCGLDVPEDGLPVANLTRPLCKTCDRLTWVPDAEEVIR